MAKNIKTNNGKDTSHKHHSHSNSSSSNNKKDDNKKDDKNDDKKDESPPKFDITNPASMLGSAEDSLKKMTGMAEGAMADGAKKLASVIMPNVNPNAVMGGMMKMAKLLAPKPAAPPAKPSGGLPKISGSAPPPSAPKPPEIKREPGEPKPWIHLPGQKGRPAETVHP